MSVFWTKCLQALILLLVSVLCTNMWQILLNTLSHTFTVTTCYAIMHKLFARTLNTCHHFVISLCMLVRHFVSTGFKFKSISLEHKFCCIWPNKLASAQHFKAKTKHVLSFSVRNDSLLGHRPGCGPGECACYRAADAPGGNESFYLLSFCRCPGLLVLSLEIRRLNFVTA